MSTLHGRINPQDCSNDLSDRKKPEEYFNDRGYQSFCVQEDCSDSDNISIIDENNFKPLSTSERIDGLSTQVNNI